MESVDGKVWFIMKNTDRHPEGRHLPWRRVLFAFVIIAACFPSCTPAVQRRWGCAADTDGSGAQTGSGGGGQAGTTTISDDGGAAGAGGQVCLPVGCESQGAECGTLDDGCGELLFCGDCASGEQCSVERKCVCTPLSCAAQGADCGLIDDACGSTVNCGGCPPGKVCNAQHACICEPVSCADQGAECGLVADGCGSTLDCGGCLPGEECDAFGACVYSCGPTAVMNQGACQAPGYPYWCANNNTCWDGATNCWGTVDCDGDGIPLNSCKCGFHFDCNAQGNDPKCIAPTQPPPCISAVQNLAQCPADYAYWCSVNGECWNAPTDCASQTDCDGDGNVDRACWCGAHVDCTQPFGQSCLPW